MTIEIASLDKTSYTNPIRRNYLTRLMARLQLKGVCPDAQESRKFWSDIWDKPVTHNESAEWLNEIENDLANTSVQEDITIDIDVCAKLKRVPNWKGPGPDGVQGYWLKNVTSPHDRMATQLNECLMQGSIPNWMTTGRSVLILKDPEKGALV